MRIQIISDLVCPWCYIGKRRLEAALKLWPEAGPHPITWHPFQLNPGLPAVGIERATYRLQKFGSREKAAELDAQVAAAGKELGLEFRFDLQIRTPNTLLAHRLVWLARDTGRQERLVEALFRAYFTDGKDLSQRGVLVSVAVDAGFEAARVEAFLDSEQGLAEIAGEEREARKLGVSAVPCLVLNHRLVVVGAQPAEALLEAFQKAAINPTAAQSACPAVG